MGAILSRLAIVGLAFLLCGCVATQGDETPDGWRRVRPFKEIGISIAIPSGYKSIPVDGIDALASMFVSPDGDAIAHFEMGLNLKDVTKQIGYQAMPVVVDGEPAQLVTYVREAGKAAGQHWSIGSDVHGMFHLCRHR